MTQILAAYQDHTDTRLDRISANIDRLSSEISSARSDSRTHVVQIAEVLQKSHELQTARLTRLQNILGVGPDMKENPKTLLERFDLLSFAVEEFLERVKDPEANLPDDTPRPLHHDMATSPPKQTADVGILPKTPTPKPRFSSIGVGSSPPSPNNDVSSKSRYSSHQSSSTIVVDDNSKEFPQSEPLGDPFGDILRKTTLSHASPVSPVARSLVPADWNPNESSQQSFTFDPDRSSAGMRVNQPPSLDGTVASLRAAILGPLMSTPVHRSPHPAHNYDDPTFFPPNEDSPSPAARDRSPTPEPSEPDNDDLLTQDPSVDIPPTDADAPLSRYPTAEPDLRSSSTDDTLREELSVSDMMAFPPSDTTASPPSPPRAESHPPAVPSSVSPPPMEPQLQVLQKSSRSPPSLKLLFTPTPTPTPYAETSRSPSPTPSPARAQCQRIPAPNTVLVPPCCRRCRRRRHRRAHSPSLRPRRHRVRRRRRAWSFSRRCPSSRPSLCRPRASRSARPTRRQGRRSARGRIL
ncbi:hypothetical protein K438DRAFT_921182 [Mycena galopus ATCC 62051]|nr:hypothetical protein K438DRAFT_921182 [Mycena galopus ATCC 62051]